MSSVKSLVKWLCKMDVKVLLGWGKFTYVKSKICEIQAICLQHGILGW